jgi:cellulose synthase/poly-beta-1,6-N-acetylglucosamine synthase-like glycosyltransferase
VLATAFSYILYAVIGLLAIPVVVLAVQVFCATTPGARRRTPMAARRPTVAVLVPAHDEAMNIGATCRALSEHLAPADRLLVVADNCSDETGDVARRAGAEVIERHDLTRIGKGYALDFGMKHLGKEPPEVLIIIDADCMLAKDAIDFLSRACATVQRPIQAIYTMRNHPGAPIRMRVAEFAGIVKNLVRPLGYRRLGLPCMLMGTGMAFPWPVVARTDLATGHIVEDMKLSVDLASEGSAPLYCPEAEVMSYFPDSLQGFKTQRTRWEHGHLGLILADAPRLFATAIRDRNGPLLAMAFNLIVPPLALLSLLVAAAGAMSVLLAILSGEPGPLWAGASVLVLLFSAVAVARARFARSVISTRELAFAPLYALLKIPVYLRFVYGKQVDWVRSARKGE